MKLRDKVLVMLGLLAGACVPKGDAGESTGGPGDASSGSTSATGGDASPTGGSGVEETGSPTSAGTSTSTASTGSTGDPAGCRALGDEVECQAAGCSFIHGIEVFIDGEGCHFGEPTGFCTDSGGGFQIPTMFFGPESDPRVIELFYDAPLFSLPDGWKPCDCEDPDAPLACTCRPTGPGCGGKLTEHCASLTDEVTCTQFDANDDLLSGCLWIEPQVRAVVDAACSAEPLPGRCIAQSFAAGCQNVEPPASCGPEDATKHPYALKVDDEVAIVDDVPCDARPLGLIPCWDDRFSPLAECECPCLPTL